jgi:RNA polymerase-binding protein DksA
LHDRRACLQKTIVAFLAEARSNASTLDVSDLLDPASPVGGNCEESFAIAERAEEMLAEIDRALDRIDEGTYGTCADCGGSIPVERLLAVPATDVCVGCRRHRDGRVEQRRVDSVSAT